MSRRNYFEILGLDFDPPEKNKRRIQKTIEEWKKRTEDLLANETIAARRTAISEELALHDDMVSTMNDNAAKNAEARALKEIRTAQLEKLIDIMLMENHGTLEVTNAQIRDVHLKLKLSPKTIEDIYKSKGFTVHQNAKALNLNEYFLSPVLAENIAGKIVQLQGTVIPKYPWTSKVTDLYDLACYFAGGSDDDREVYHKKRTADLYSVMETGAAQYASDMSAQGHLMADLFTAGTTQVFNSEANRKKYDMSLQRAKLREFFLLLKSAPEIFKKDRYFADTCIRTIQKSFPDYNIALALYNLEAGLLKDPYEPFEALIHLTCGSCKTPAEFRTREEAERGKCAVCGAPLYIECPKCHKKTPASADRCSCGFQISEMQFFDEYVRACEFALSEMDFVEAARQFMNAENAYPGNPKLSPLSKKIEAERQRYEKPLNEIKALIAAGKYCAAQKFLGSVIAAMPHLRLDAQKKIIDAKLAEAKRMMPAAAMPPSERANRCMDILAIVEDYQPAIDILTTIRPMKPLNLTAATTGTNPLTCMLTWNAAGDKGVKYHVVRKKNGMPRGYADGEVIASEINSLSCKDISLQPGISYGYAVFACRRGVYSDPVTCVVENFSDLDSKNLRYSADNGVCRFSWVLPPNCIGVRILRSENAIPQDNPGPGCIIVASRESGHFEDSGVTNNNSYGYRLQCIYPYGSSFKFSKGLTCMLTPEQPPVAVRDVSSRVDGRLVTIRWTSPDNIRRNVVIREVASSSANSLIGQVIPVSDINSMIGNGRNYANTTSTAAQAQFEIPQDTSCDLAVICIAGSNGIISDIVRVSSVEKCEIDRRKTRIEGNRLVIVLANKPKNLEMIHYIVAKKTSSKVPWATIEDVRHKTMSVVSLKDYERDGMIVVDMPPKSDLYITVIGQYRMKDGSVLYSDPSKIRLSNKPKETISYRFIWSGGGFFSRSKAKGCRLIVTSNAEETPKIYVVYKNDGHIPMKLKDPKVIVIHKIPRSDRGFENGVYEYQIPDSTWSAVPPKTQLRLFIDDEDAAEFVITPSDLESCKVP